MSCWRRIRISATSFVLGLKNEAMIWRISRSNSIIKWQGYRVSPSRLAESNFRYTQAAVDYTGAQAVAVPVLASAMGNTVTRRTDEGRDSAEIQRVTENAPR